MVHAGGFWLRKETQNGSLAEDEEGNLRIQFYFYFNHSVVEGSRALPIHLMNKRTNMQHAFQTLFLTGDIALNEVRQDLHRQTNLAN